MTATVRGTSYEHNAEDATTDMIRVNTGEVTAACTAIDWSEDMSANRKVNPDCQNNIGTNWTVWEPSDEIDEWIRWNQQRDVLWMKRFNIENQEVLGTTSARLMNDQLTPTLTSLVTPTPSTEIERTQTTTSNPPVNTQQRSPIPSNPTPTATPMTPTPIPSEEKPEFPASIKDAQILQVADALLMIQVSGSGFQKGDSIILKDPNGQQLEVRPYSLDQSPESYVGGSLLFPKICGRYEVAVQRNGQQITELYSGGLNITVCLENPSSLLDLGGLLR